MLVNDYFRHICSLTLVFSLAACGPLHDLSDMHDDMKGLRVDLKDMSSKLDTTNNNMEGMSKKLDDTNEEMKSLHGDMKDMKDYIKGMSEQMTSLNKSIIGMHTDMTLMIGFIKTMADQMTGVRNDMGEMKTSVNSMSEKMGTLLEKMTGMYATMQVMAIDVKGALSRMDLLVEDMKSVSKDMGELKGSIKTMATQMTTMNEGLNKMVGMMGDLDKAIGSMSAKMDHLDSSMQGMTGMLSEMKKTMTDMKNDLAQMFSGMRMVLARQSRQEAMEAMDKATTEGAKFGFAGEYMGSQEYQAWNPSVKSIDTPAYRLEMMKIAANDFFLKINPFIKDRNDTNASDLRPTNNKLNLFALAATLDFVNIAQTNALATLPKKDRKVVTMLSMIEDGIRADRYLRNGTLKKSQITKYENEVMVQLPTAVYLLRLRQNFMKGLAFTLLATAADGNDPTLLGDFTSVPILPFPIPAGNGSAFKVLFKWVPNFSEKNISQVEMITTALTLAAETEEFLNKMYIDPKIDTTVRSTLQKIQMDKMENALLKKFNSNHTEVEKLKDALNRVIDLDRKH